ncbi:BON domain-containing protein [Burkholderia sp. IMCC1007]|uniref:BON domain-containing protein n=1 Tax=Burkholderia sp. IMCC1007 TaxID=3004104 RepID=UPI0022B406AD|nr:BON domain-containing protein [Burkholderia sp. IMCC1007]
MERRYPGRPGGRGGAPDWQERNERAYRGVGRGIPDDPSLRPDEDYESAYRRFASEDVGPEDWGSEWSERSARSAAERGRGSGDWHGGPGGPRDPAWEAQRGQSHSGQRSEGGPARDTRYGGGQPQYRGHHRMGWYGGEREYDPRDSRYQRDPRDPRDARDPRDPRDPRGQRRADAPDLSRFGGDPEREALRYRRGPKGYTRSDERIREDVCERLAHALEIDVSDVTVQVSEGRVELDGTVPARWMKHDIEDIADDCTGVRDVENRVRVRRDGEHDTGMVLHPAQRTVTPTQPPARDPEPGSGAGSSSGSSSGAGARPGGGSASSSVPGFGASSGSGSGFGSSSASGTGSGLGSSSGAGAGSGSGSSSGTGAGAGSGQDRDREPRH